MLKKISYFLLGSIVTMAVAYGAYSHYDMLLISAAQRVEIMADFSGLMNTVHQLEAHCGT